MLNRVSERGAALIIAIVSIVIIGGTSAAFLILAIDLNRETEERKARINSLMVAESGIRIQWQIMNNMAADVIAGTGTWTIQDQDVVSAALPWGNYEVLFSQVAGTDDWTLTSTGTSTAAGGGGTMQRTVEVLAKAVYANAPGPFGYAVMVDSAIWGVDFYDPVFTDSFDSSAGGYNPNAPTTPFTLPWELSGGTIASNGDIAMYDNGTEIHGLVQCGESPATTIPAGELERGYDPPAEEPFENPAVDAGDMGDARTSNDNATLPASAYDAWGMELNVFWPDVVQLGDPGGQPRTYYFNFIGTWGGTIEFVGPCAIYLNGDMYNTTSNDLSSTVRPQDVLIYAGRSAQNIYLDGDTSFGCGLYAPQSDVEILGQGEIFGSYVVRRLTRTGPLAIHYDEALGTIGAQPTGPVERFDITAWYEH